jgi:hypothetical protein
MIFPFPYPDHASRFTGPGKDRATSSSCMGAELTIQPVSERLINKSKDQARAIYECREIHINCFSYCPKQSSPLLDCCCVAETARASTSHELHITIGRCALIDLRIQSAKRQTLMPKAMERIRAQCCGTDAV